MNKEELIHEIYEGIVKIKNETNKEAIKKHLICPIVNYNTCEETGQAATLVCSTKFEYPEDVLNHWKEQLGASEYYIKVNRLRLFITFVVHYKDWEMKDE